MSEKRLAGLEPGAVFGYFEELCAIPHGSRNTKAISDYLVAFAKEQGVRCIQDESNNIIMFVDGTCGMEEHEPVILQGHMDMVCARAEGCDKDMASEGLDIATDGQWIWAEGTSLGGDDGAAVAMILAILDDDSLAHPPIEAVLTVDEEVGMGGAAALDCTDLRGRKLLNLDSEQEGIFTVSCAGGLRMDCHIPAATLPAEGMDAFALALSGLQGGHSGTDIHRGRGSANQLMSRVL